MKTNKHIEERAISVASRAETCVMGRRMLLERLEWSIKLGHSVNEHGKKHTCKWGGEDKNGVRWKGGEGNQVGKNGINGDD